MDELKIYLIIVWLAKPPSHISKTLRLMNIN